MFNNTFQKKFEKQDFPLLNTTELNEAGDDYVKSHDIASVDYNSDGFKDIVFTTKAHIYYLTSMMASSKHGQNDFLAVVLEGNGEVNKYGIGSSLRLKVRNKSTTNVHYFYKSINSFSHGTTNNGGAADHRVFFGLGKLYKPIELSIMWPNNRESLVNKADIIKSMNNARDPLRISYPKVTATGRENSRKF